MTFSKIYDAGIQLKFTEALRAGKYKEAYDFLQSLPPARDTRAFPEADLVRILRENADRLIVLTEGYEVLVPLLLKDKERALNTKRALNNLETLFT